MSALILPLEDVLAILSGKYDIALPRRISSQVDVIRSGRAEIVTKYSYPRR